MLADIHGVGRMIVVGIIYMALLAGYLHSGLFDKAEIWTGSYGLAVLGLVALSAATGFAEGRWWTVALAPAVWLVFLPVSLGENCGEPGFDDICLGELAFLVFTPLAALGLAAGVAARLLAARLALATSR